jgi:hypothetical protein
MKPHTIYRTLNIDQPERLKELSDMLGGQIGTQIRLAELRLFVDQDVQAALNRVTILPAGSEREQLLSVLADYMVGSSPARAIEWATEVERRLPGATRVVLNEIAATDVLLAIDHALDLQMPPQLIAQWTNAGRIESIDEKQIRQLAAKLAAAGTSQQRAFSNLMFAWPQVDPNAAIDWLMEQGGAVDTAYVQQLARGLVVGNVELASSIARNLPANSRGTWVAEVAGAYMSLDMEAATAWLAQFNAEPNYEDWAFDVAVQLLNRNPNSARRQQSQGANAAAAASLLSNLSRAPDDSVTAAISSRYSLLDPIAALQWAQRLPTQGAQQVGIAAAIGGWTIADPRAAKARAMDLPNGPIRDRALGAYMAQNIDTHGTFDESALQEFSSARARDEALARLSRAFVMLGSRESDRAAELVREHIEEGGLRENISNEISRWQENAGISLPPDALVPVVPATRN